MKKFIALFIFAFLIVLSGCSKKYTITFETNGAGDIESVEVTDGKLEKLPEISKTGYIFKGWFKDEAFTQEFKIEEKITSDLTLYAKWEVIKYTVRFVDHDGKELKKESVEYGKGATAPANPTREGHTFSGWDKAFNKVTSDLTVTATYDVIKFTVKFVDHDGTQIGEEVTVEWGKNVTPPSNPTREGYKFTGWDKPLENVTSNLTITATYEPLKFTVVFKDHNGTVLKEYKDVAYGAAVDAPSNPSRDGYTFAGWDKEFSSIKENLTITAKYTPITYYIKYFDGTTLLEISPDTYDITKSINLPTYNKDGFLFVGWFKDQSLTEEIKSIPVGSKGDVNVYGKWLDTSKKYTVTYELNGGKWTWDLSQITVPGDGIDKDSDLPELFMQDFYTYLKDKELLNSPLVAEKLRKTTWTEFSKNYTDPVAIYNHTSTNTSGSTDGYSQFFYDTATGDPNTLLITSIEGGFFGTEPYKSKYAHVAQLIAYLVGLKYSGTYFWSGPSGKALGGFVLDGYFYGTQGVGNGGFASVRSTILNTNLKIKYANSVATTETVTYQITEYVQGLSVTLVAPFKLGYAFRGWYTTPDFQGEPVTKIEAGVAPAATYYAKWEAIQ